MNDANDKTPRKRGRPRIQKSESSGQVVQALDRGLTVLRALSKSNGMTLSDVALQVGMPASTAHRILITLQKYQFVEHEENTQQWTVGIEAFRVGSAYLERTNLVDAARQPMRELTATTGETANLAITDNGDVVFISQVESHNAIRAFFRPGTRGPMHASGIGKMLLSCMSRNDVETILQLKGLEEFTPRTLSTPRKLFDDLTITRARGWSFDDEERYLGMRCVASAIFNSYGEPVAGVSISGPTVRLPDASVYEMGPKIQRCAATITEKIGGVVPETSDFT